MSFDFNQFQTWSSGFDVGGNKEFAYTKLGVGIAAITASGYFDPVNLYVDGVPANNIISQYDLIYVVCDDYQAFIQVTDTTTTITTTQFQIEVGTGEIGTTNLADDAVTEAKLADDAVSTDKIVDGDVTSAKLEDLLVHHARVTMTAAQWDGMYATPYELVAAPGATEKLIPMRVAINLDYGGTVFANGGAIVVQYDDTTHAGGVAATGTLAAATFIGYTADTSFCFTPVDSTIADATTLGTGLFLSNASGAFTGGTSSAFIVDVWYAIADYA